jgi:glycerol-3-phosphate dehydrogenase (NAD(P)+)
MKQSIGIIGGGSWGTAIGLLLNNNHHAVKIWEFDKKVIQAITAFRKNKQYLPGIYIPKKIEYTNNFKKVVSFADILIIAIPSEYFSSILSQLKKIYQNQIIVSLTKGLDAKKLLFPSEIFLDIFGKKYYDNFVSLCGPSHAEEVARKIPTTVVASSNTKKHSRLIQKIFTNKFFRVYSGDDLIGSEIGGALKNSIAIAAGINDGLGFGDNSKAALMTRGIAEISRFGKKYQANPKTFSGLTGIGDLIVTCCSRHSRNWNFGNLLAKGYDKKESLKIINQTVEGMVTAKSIHTLAEQLHIEMPIVKEVYNVIYKNKNPLAAVTDLMSRKNRPEF